MKNMKILLVAVTWILAANAGFAADKKPTGDETSKAPQQRVLKIDDTEVDMTRLEKEESYSLNQVVRHQKLRNGKEADLKFDRRVQYFRKSKRIAYVEDAIYDDAVQGHLRVYTEKGVKVFEKKLEPENGVHRSFQTVKIIGSRNVVVFTGDIYTERKKRLEVYDTDNNLTIYSTSCALASTISIPPSEDYFLFTAREPGESLVQIYKYDFKNYTKIAEADRLQWNAFSNDGKKYVLLKSAKDIEKTVSGGDLKKTEIQYFAEDKLIWRKTVKYESMKMYFSGADRYLILQFKKDVKFQGKYVASWTDYFTVLDCSGGQVVAEGEFTPEQIAKYKNEGISGGVR